MLFPFAFNKIAAPIELLEHFYQLNCISLYIVQCICYYFDVILTNCINLLCKSCISNQIIGYIGVTIIMRLIIEDYTWQFVLYEFY